MMSDNTTLDDLDETEVPTSYTSSTPAAATNRPAIKHLVAELDVVKKQLLEFA
jgi:hypothetical protein